MINLKESKFNFITEHNGNFLIYNSLTNVFYKLNHEQYERFGEKNLNEKELLQILEDGLLVEDNVDEDKLADIKYYSLINNNVLRLIILPTMQCNFRCKYCYESFNGENMTDEVMESIISFIKKEIIGKSAIQISWFGGEPLLVPEKIKRMMKEIIKIANYYKVKIFSDITTNAYLLSLEVFKNLLAVRVNNFQITIDGTKNNHDNNRCLINGEGTYSKIISNLINIKKNIESRFFTITIRVNVSKEVLDNMEEVFANLYKTFADDSRFVFLFRAVGDWGGDKVKEMSDSLISQNNILDELLRTKFKFTLHSQFLEFEKLPLCYASCKNSYAINPLGELMKCTVALEAEFNKVGKIMKDGNYVLNNNICSWLYCKNKNEMCENCSLYANCFNSRCGKVHIEGNNGYFQECKQLDKKLKVIYNMSNVSFKEL